MNQNYGLSSRRSFLHLTGSGGMALAAAVMGSEFWNMQPSSALAAGLTLLEPNAALKRLMDGNQRFVQQKSVHPDQSQARATILSQDTLQGRSLSQC